LAAETASMLDISAQGLLFDTKFDYQVSWFSMKINNKLTQLVGNDPVSLVNYTYWANTGNQQNTGIEASLGYIFTPKKNSFVTKLKPFVSLSNYNFTYRDFKTKFGSAVVDYTSKKVVGVPTMKYTIGCDIKTKMGFYMNNTFNSIGDVYTDFANTNLVKGYTSLNSKIGFKKSFLSNNLDVDAYFAGNNLTNQINYTFLFLGNNVKDSDPGSGFPSNVATDINPGYSKTWYYCGVSLMYHIK
jgi:iron complex outermembrane receptor protein